MAWYLFYSLLTFLYLWENVPWSYYIKFIFVQNLKLENLQLRMENNTNSFNSLSLFMSHLCLLSSLLSFCWFLKEISIFNLLQQKVWRPFDHLRNNFIYDKASLWIFLYKRKSHKLWIYLQGHYNKIQRYKHKQKDIK